MTRPRAQSEAFVTTLPDTLKARLDILIAPLIEITETQASYDIAPKDAAIFTSANGAAFGPEGAGRIAYCVGAATTKAATARGWQAQNAGQDAAHLIEYLMQQAPKARLWHLSGVHTRGNIAQKLGDAGLDLRHVAIYDQALRPLPSDTRAWLDQGKNTVLPLFSPRTAEQFAQQTGQTHHIHVIALSASVAEALAGKRFASCDIARAPTAKAMIEAMERRIESMQMG